FGPVAATSCAWWWRGRRRANATVGEGSPSNATRTPAIGVTPTSASGTRYQVRPFVTCAVTASAGRSLGARPDGLGADSGPERGDESGWAISVHDPRRRTTVNSRARYLRATC